MNISSALSHLGIEHTIRGPEPRTQSEYEGTIEIAGVARPRVTTADPRPDWSTIEQVLSELSAPTADDVRAEAARRIRALVGARDTAHLEIVLSNLTREHVRLLSIDEGLRTRKQITRMAQLARIDEEIEAIRKVSNEMEDAPGLDFADPVHWPPECAPLA